MGYVHGSGVRGVWNGMVMHAAMNSMFDGTLTFIFDQHQTRSPTLTTLPFSSILQGRRTGAVVWDGRGESKFMC
jgi:hypothetical protein